MFRNSYDTDVITWSPQGRLHQVRFLLPETRKGKRMAIESIELRFFILILSLSFSLSFSLVQKIAPFHNRSSTPWRP